MWAKRPLFHFPAHWNQNRFNIFLELSCFRELAANAGLDVAKDLADVEHYQGLAREDEDGQAQTVLSHVHLMNRDYEAALAAQSGCHAVIASGRRPAVIEEILNGKPLGTCFVARGGYKDLVRQRGGPGRAGLR